MDRETYKDSYEMSIGFGWPSTCLRYWREAIICDDVKAYFEDGSVDIWKNGHCKSCPKRREMAYRTFCRYWKE